MANERLRRTPTSSGNRMTHTWSGWVKRNQLGAWERLFSTAGQTLLQLTGSPPDQIRYLDQTGANYDLRSNILLRDVGSWMHIVFSVDHTQTAPKDRVRIYLNGVEVDFYATDSTSNGVQNLETYFNSITEHSLLGRETANSGENFRGEAFDIFWVDGQALTPEVFGFYKDGKGYQSSGTKKVTDFRPGQWSPRLPKSIKYEINRLGGFGSNGFYLPMNDSSNPGADFHCAPDSIITLKGEDLPQPRNGLPTTSDNYVSQLRSDPYAANLVLAVPGVNTQPTGSELVTNGTFDTNVSNWTISDTGTIVRQSDGTARVTRGSTARVVYQDITTVVGTTYELSVDITDIGGSHGQVYVYSTDHGGNLDTSIGYSFSTGTYKGTFTADATTTRISLYAHPTGYTSYDNVSVKATTIRDYSADIKGSGTNKTLTSSDGAGVRSPNGAGGVPVYGYYGSALSFDGDGDHFTVAASSDFVYGSGDFTIEFWWYPTDTTRQALYHGSFGADYSIGIDYNSTGTNTIGIWASSSGSSWNLINADGGGNGIGRVVIPQDQWCHFVYERRGNQWTSYVNGVADVTVNVSGTVDINASDIQAIGAWWNSETAMSDVHGYIQDFRIYKGVAKYTGGFDVPKPYKPVGIESWRQLPDTSRNNFATWNTISGNETSGQFSFADGNLTASTTTSNVSVTSNFGMSSGKWYWEYCPAGIENFHDIGISHLENPPVGFDDGTLSASWRTSTGQIRQGNTDVQATGLSASEGDIVQIAFDADTRKMWVGVNGSYFGGADPATGTNTTYQTNLTASTYFFAASLHQSGTTNTHTGIANFGQNPTFSGTKIAGTTYTDSNGRGLFKYQPPTGFLALCTDNLSTPAIADPGKHFKAVLYTGSGNLKSINQVGFKPDLVWLKCRTDGKWHALVDSVRGNTKTLFSNDSTVEVSETHVPSFNSDGFTVADIDSGTSNEDEFGYVAWCWKAGGPTVTNNDGSITSQVSVNQDAGFSIVTYTGNGSSSATVGHGLNKTPAFSIIKSRTSGGSVNDWWTYIGSDDYARVRLNLTQPATIGDNNNALKHAPDTSVFTLANFLDNNVKYIVYSWAEVENYSKVGTYIGNGLDDGPMIVCGFKPAWVMVKRLTTGSNEGWPIYDNVRGSVNPNPKGLYANAANLENDASGRYKDFLSNGFKIRGTSGEQNTDGIEYLYVAFAESPLQTANAK